MNLERDCVWKSERRFRSELDPKKLKDVAIPDGLITAREGLIAIEVEISAIDPSTPGGEAAKARSAVGVPVFGRSYGHAYAAIWFVCPQRKDRGCL